MSLQTITVHLTSLVEPEKTFIVVRDIDYSVLHFIIDLKKYDEKLGLYSLVLPKSGLVSPLQLSDTIHDQLRGQHLDVKVFHPITYRNSFNFINHLVGLYENDLLETTNLMDVEPINQAKIGECIVFGRGTIHPAGRTTASSTSSGSFITIIIRCATMCMGCANCAIWEKENC